MAAPIGIGATETTDAVALDGADRISGVLSLEYLFGGLSRQLTIKIQGSDDGTAWVDVATWAVIGTAPVTLRLVAGEVTFAFVRLEYELIGSPPPPTPAPVFAGFDVHAILDKS